MIKELLELQLSKNKNADEIKDTVKGFVKKVEGFVYEQFTTDEEQFLEKYALAKVGQDSLAIVAQVTSTRLNSIAESIFKGEITLPQPVETIEPPQQPQVPLQNVLADEIHKREEYPISANFDYWSQNHSKSLQVREYMNKLHEKDKIIKEQLRSKRMAIEQLKRRKQEEREQEQSLMQQQKKQQIKQRALQKIKEIKRQQAERQAKNKEFKEFYREFRASQPLHAKLQNQFKTKFEMPLLEERKRKLENIRSIRRQPSLTEIEMHMKKHDQQMNSHVASSIINEPVQVSYRSKFHSTLEVSSADNTAHDLFERKVNYGKMVRQNYQPVVSQRLAQQIQQRLQGNKGKKKRYQDQDEQDDQNSENQQKPPVEVKNNDDQDDQDDEDDSKKDEYVPKQSECLYRNKLGNDYLDFVRKLKKKDRPTKEDYIRRIEEQQRLEKESKKRIIRPNYLNEIKQMRSQSAAAKSPLDDWEEDLKNKRLGEVDKKRRMLMKSQRIVEKAQRRQLELAHHKLNQTQLIDQRKKVDGQYLEAIKAKLALMQV